MTVEATGFKKATRTGITVNVVQAGDDELIERLRAEGLGSPADLLITVDAGRLHRAQVAGLLQPVSSPVLEDNIPAAYRHPEGYWYGLTLRARVIAYHKDRVRPAELSTYQALTDPKWKGRLLIRSSSSIYNQSLLAAMVAETGVEGAEAWARGIVANLARPPLGADRDQIKAVAAGVGDLAVVNTYYVGLLLSSADPAERDAAARIGVFFPNQDGRGTHVNVSGGAVTASAKNRQNAIGLLEYLSSPEAQRIYAEVNFEYPVNQDAPTSPLLAEWGAFRIDPINLSAYGQHNAEAVRIFDRVGWR